MPCSAVKQITSHLPAAVPKSVSGPTMSGSAQSPTGGRSEGERLSKTTTSKSARELTVNGLDQLEPYPGKKVIVFKIKLELDPAVVGERPFGAHYLTDRANLIYTFVNNPGAYVDDYNVLFSSKATLQYAVITFITSTYPSLTYDVDKCRRDVGYIVDALSIDLRDGGKLETLNNALMYQGQLPANQVTETAAALDYLATQIAPLLTTDAQVISNSFIGGIANIIRGTGFNAPKDNDALDVFLMNDATIIRNLSVQGHGGFMEVLDPEGQILTKSPYTQTCSSFSKSLAPKVSFAGGMFVDGFCGNQDARIVQANSTTEIVIDNIYREPQTPTSFFIDGVRWQINKVDRVGVLWLKSKSRGEDKTGKRLKGKKWEVAESKRSIDENLEILSELGKEGYSFIVATNQPGVAIGNVTESFLIGLP